MGKSIGLILIFICLLQMQLNAAICTYEHVVNGGFEQNYCNSDWCNFRNNQPNMVYGWEAAPQIEIGNGKIYNSVLSGYGRVAELDAQGNTCIRQRLNIKQNSVVLKFLNAAKEGHPLETSQLIFRFAGHQYKVSARGYGLYQVNMRLEINPGAHVIQFCGIGASDKVGIAIDNVSIVSYYNC